MLLTASARASELEAAARELNRLAESGERPRALLARYREQVSPSLAGAASCSDACLRLAFEAVSIALFYGHGAVGASDARVLFQTLEKRRLVDATLARRMYGHLVLMRDFEQAERLRRRFALKDLVPVRLKGPPSEGGTRRALVPGRGSKVSSTVVDLSESRLLVLMRPTCEFTQAAFKAIEADPALSRLLERRATLLVPPSDGTDFASLRRWNSTHARFPAVSAYSTGDWSEIPDWSAVPVFYRVVAGRIAESFAGWPDDSRLEVLRAWARPAEEIK